MALAIAFACVLVNDKVWFDPARLAPIETYALDNKDSAVFALARARSPERAKADVVLLGSSAARESLWDEATWRNAGNLHVSKLASSAQTPVESLFLLDQQALRAGQLLILSVGVSQLSSDDKGTRLSSGVFLQDATSFVSAYPDLLPAESNWLGQRRQSLAGARNLFGRYLRVALPRQIAQEVYGASLIMPLESYYTRQVSAEGIGMQRQKLRRDIEMYGKDNLRSYLSAIDAIAKRCKREGATLLLLESPHLNSDLLTTFAAAWGPYRQGMQEVANRHGVRYMDMSGKVVLTPNDFVDVIHVAQSGRDAWSEQLLREIALLRTTGT